MRDNGELMASVLNRITKRYIKSANTPDFPAADWIIEPDISAVAGFARKYWVITGDVVSLMAQVDRDALDTVEAEAGKDTIANTINSDAYLSAFALVVLDELNARANKINAILDAIDGANNLADVKAAIGAIPDYPQRTKAQLKTSVRSKL